MSTSQHSQLSIVPGIGRREEPEPSDGRYEPTIGLKAVAKILDCSVFIGCMCRNRNRAAAECFFTHYCLMKSGYNDRRSR